MIQSLGKSIKQIRKEKHLSQKGLANQICSQSMLSSIENDLYTPNALLLIKLCEKLSINLSQISLSEAEINLTMALSIKSNPVLNHLVLASLSLVLSTSKPNEAKEYLGKATSNLNQLNYAENLNIIFYLAAFINLKLHQFEIAINWINDGITFITRHNSH